MLKKCVVFVVLAMSLVAFSNVEITYADDGPPSWVSTENFVPPKGAKKASGKFSGTLSFTTTEMNTTPEQLPVRYPWAWWGIFDFLSDQDPEDAVPVFDLDAKLFPGLEVQFFTTKKGDLVPVQRGIIRKPVKDRTESFWEIIIGPGKVWQEKAKKKDKKKKGKEDEAQNWKGWNKAAFPFSLVQSQEGEAFIGLAFFYYKGNKVSKLYIQISQDTAGGFIFWDNSWDMTAWGEVDITYTPGTVKDEKALQKAFKKEVANRFRMEPLKKLKKDVSGMGGDVNQDNVLTMAMLVDDVIYHSPINTPFGEYPYPDGMRVGVWSASKSLIPGMAALRLAEKYGTDFLYTKIVEYFQESVEFDYIDEVAEARWKMVTIDHALHMTTGMGPAGSDPNWAMSSLNTYQWSYSYDLEDQIWYYFNQGPVPDDEVTGPGQKLYYVDQDMWIATLAMERFLQDMEGPDATILNMLIEEVYKPIGVDHFVAGTGYTESGEVGFPFSAWGVLPTIDYLAKAGRLIANKGKTEDGTQILSKDLIEDFFTNSNYQLAYWKTTFTNDAGTKFYIPRMSGAGGNYVFSMPNGLVGIALGYNKYYFGWSNTQRLTIVEAANNIDPF
jgi:CubicO group peptidase (beta-lactamase class C family)